MKKPDDFRTKLGGKTWSIYFVRKSHKRLRGNYGICYRDSREIYVRYDVSQKNFIDTLIHECQHALSDMHFSAEEWVTQTSTELAVALLAAGVSAGNSNN